MSTTEAAPAKAERWTAQWKHLFDEVVTSGLCTGCSGCVVACPHDVLGYNDVDGVYKPFHLEEELGPANCGHGEKGCTSCTRACPRFRTWETEIDTFMRQRLERLVADMDFVPREEFEAVKAMAAKARAENDALAARLKALEDAAGR